MPSGRAVFGDAAIYVDRDRPDNIAGEIEHYERDPELKQAVVANGHQALAEYPSIDSRVRQEIEFLRNVYESS